MMGDDRRDRRLSGGWLRAARLRAGFTVQADFARAIGIDKSLLSNYETGKTRPSDENARRIAKVLRMPELEVRRDLGLWVPDGDEAPSQVEELSADLVARARRIEELARELARDAEEEQRRRGAHEDEDRRRGA